MSNATSGTGHWHEVRDTLRAKLESFYGRLDAAHANARLTFSDRLSKATGRTMKDKLAACRNAVETNYRLAQAHRVFCEKLVTQSDTVFQKAVGEFKKVPWAKELSGIAATGEMALAAQTAAGTAKIVVDALSLCGFLGGLLGHKEAKAFEKGAIKELQGAIFDPGAGVVTLLRRLYAVASRTLRADQDADELLESLDTFVDLMTQWRAAMVMMSQGQTFAQAVQTAFGSLVKKSSVASSPRGQGPATSRRSPPRSGNLATNFNFHPEHEKSLTRNVIVVSRVCALGRDDRPCGTRAGTICGIHCARGQSGRGRGSASLLRHQ